MQEVIVYIIIGIAAASLVYKYVKPKKKKDCGPDCNC